MLCCCAADEEDEWRPPQPQPRLKKPMAPPPPPPDAAPAAARTVALAGEGAAWEASESVEALASEDGEDPGTAAAAGGGGEAPEPRTVVEVALGEPLLALCPMAAAALLPAGVGELEVKSTISCAAEASLDSVSSSMIVFSDLEESEVELESTEVTEQM